MQLCQQTIYTHCFSGRTGLGELKRREPKKPEELSFVLAIEGALFTSPLKEGGAGREDEACRTLRDVVWLRIGGGRAAGAELFSRIDVLLNTS